MLTDFASEGVRRGSSAAHDRSNQLVRRKESASYIPASYVRAEYHQFIGRRRTLTALDLKTRWQAAKQEQRNAIRERIVAGPAAFMRQASRREQSPSTACAPVYRKGRV
jgi:hypothetical protein